MAQKLRCTLLAALLLLAPAAARAQPEPQSRTGVYSRYEDETIRLVLGDRRWQLDPAPEGKVIEGIEVVALDVIEPRDPAPALLNALHRTSRDHVIRREVLVRPGEPYRKVLVDETARNLRRLPQLSVVLCLAVQGDGGGVRLVVITKDVWSLRLSWDVALSPSGLEYLVLAPSETNLLGTQQTVGGRLEILPASYAAGLRYVVPRVLGSRVAAYADANVIVNRDSDRPEGSFGSVSVQRPLFSTRTPWAYGASVAWRDEILRRYVNAQVITFDARATPEPDRLPFLYRSRRTTAQASVTRSFGWALKLDVSGGAELLLRRFAVPDADRYPSAVVDEFRRTRVPTSDDRLSPFVQLRSYTTNFLRTIDLDTLALQEDVRLGHDVSVRLYPSFSGLGSTRTLLGAAASASYTVPLDNGYARLAATSITEREPDRLADGSIEVDARIVTPRLPVGRLVFDAMVLNRYRNYLNRISFLGGDGRLRGWPSSFFDGKDVVAYNIEFRTRPVQILSCQLGGALFYDVGDAADGLPHIDPKQSVGLGFRALFPQLDRVVFRGDVGFPMQRGGLPQGVRPASFFVAFLQAFGDER